MWMAGSAQLLTIVVGVVAGGVRSAVLLSLYAVPEKRATIQRDFGDCALSHLGTARWVACCREARVSPWLNCG